MEAPQTWERLLWRGRSRAFPRTTFALTDVRLVAVRAGRTEELTLYDIGAIEQTRSWLDRALRTSTLIVGARDLRRRPMRLEHIREGDELRWLLGLVAGNEAGRSPDVDAVHTAPPRRHQPKLRVGAVGLMTALLIAITALVRQQSMSLAHLDDGATSPQHEPTSQEDMIRFMEDAVMPWARAKLAPIVGGVDQVRCETCHGPTGREQAWRMPAVAALPEEAVRDRGWERYSDGMDPQLRNAIYGYGAESEKQGKATYMREIVMPGMARLLGRPAYDFTRTYDFNRRSEAFGCYHCHRVR